MDLNTANNNTSSPSNHTTTNNSLNNKQINSTVNSKPPSSRFKVWESEVPPLLPREAQLEGESVRDVIPQPVDCASSSAADLPSKCHRTNNAAQQTPSANNLSFPYQEPSQLMTSTSSPERLPNVSPSINGMGSVNPKQDLAPAPTLDVPNTWTEPLAAAGAGTLPPQASNHLNIYRRHNSVPVSSFTEAYHQPASINHPDASSTIGLNHELTQYLTANSASSISIDFSKATNEFDMSTPNHLVQSPVPRIRLSDVSSICDGMGSVNPLQDPVPAPTLDVPNSWTEPLAAAGTGTLPPQASNYLNIRNRHNAVPVSSSTEYDHRPARSNHASYLNNGLPQNPITDSSSTTSAANTKETIVLQWNVRSVWKNYAEFRKIVDDNFPLAICLQEMMTEKTNNLLKNRYHWIIQSRPESLGKGIVGLGLRKDIPYQVISHSSSLHVCVGRIGSPWDITIVSLYAPHTISSQELIVKLNDLLCTLQPPFLLCGDFNAAHEAWGSAKSNIRGRLLLEWAVDNNFLALNNGSPTHYHATSGSFSAIDVSFASNCLASKFSWQCDEDLYGSDHFPIYIRSHYQLPTITSNRRWLYKDADWTNFETIVSEKIPPGSDLTIEEITHAILEAAQGSIPRTKGTSGGKKRQIWWNENVSKAIKQRRKALRKLKRLKDGDPAKQEAKRNFAKAKVESRKIVEAAKRKSWIDFQEIFSARSSSSHLWQSYNKLNGKRRTNGPGLTIEGEYTNNVADIADHFADFFATTSATAGYSEHFLNSKVNREANVLDLQSGGDTMLNQDFSIHELFQALHDCKGTSVGPDDIGYPMIKHLPFHCKVSLLKAYNTIWSTGEIPTSWKQSVIIPIVKPGENGKLASGYRPISLTSCLSKTMERMVNHRLITHLETQSSLHPRQFAFRKGKGTTTYLAELDQIITEAATKGQHCEIVTLDIKKAYDRVWHGNIMEAVIDNRLGTKMNKFIFNFLQDRTARVSFAGNLSKTTKQENGVPQGSVLSVSLFLLVMNSVFTVVPKNVHVLLYADDIVIITTGKRVGFLRRRLQKAVHSIEQWAINIGFDLSPTKSTTMHCCKMKRHRRWHLDGGNIILGDTQIEKVKLTRILGVLFDQKCNYNQHVKKLKEDCQSRLNLLKAISRRADRKSLLYIGEATIVSKLLYGAEVLRRENFENLTPIFNQMIRIASGALRTTPTLPLIVESGCLPFQHRATLSLVRKACSVLEKYPKDSNYLWVKANSAFQELTGSQLPHLHKVMSTYPRPWHKKGPSIDWTIKTEIKAGHAPQLALASFRKLINQKYNQYDQWYTDGSLADGRVGLGVIGPSSRLAASLPGQCSVFSAEAAALLVATKNAKDKSIILTDSASCLQALETGKSRNPFIQAIEQAAVGKEVHYCWIPGHSKIPGNENADKAANEGRQQSKAFNLVPAQDISKWCQKEVWKAHQANWNIAARKNLRIIKPTVNRWNDRSNRKEQIVLTRLRLGHTWLTKNHLFERRAPDQCDTCNRCWTVHHILAACTRFDQQRKEMALSNDLQEILSNNKNREDKILKFIKKLGMYEKI